MREGGLGEERRERKGEEELYCILHLVSLCCRSRLKEEMLALLDDSFLQYRETLALSSFKFHKPPAHPNCTEWLGGW